MGGPPKRGNWAASLLVASSKLHGGTLWDLAGGSLTYYLRDTQEANSQQQKSPTHPTHISLRGLRHARTRKV